MINKLLPKLVKNININILSAFSTCGILAIIICFLYAFVPQELDIDFIKANFQIPLHRFVAEQAERASYIVSLLLVIPLFSGLYILFSKKIKLKNDIAFLNKITGLPSLIIFLLILTVAFVAIYDHEIWALFLCVLFGYFVYMFKDRQFWYSKPAALISVSLACIFVIKAVYLYLSKDIMAAHIEYTHFANFIYPIFKVENGLTPGVDFYNVYGNYPYIYLFLSKILGPWTMNKIIYFNMGLLVFSWGAVGFGIYKFIKNKLLFLSVFVLFVYFTGGQGQYYLQTNPLRIINFTLVWLWAGLILFGKDRNIKIYILLGFITNCVGIIWNFESGIISLVAYSAFLIYRQALMESIKSKKFYKNSLIYLLCSVFTFLLAMIICVLIPYFRTGNMLSAMKILWGINLFYKVGYDMLKISPSHPWFVPLVFYLIALIMALNPILQLKRNKKPYLPFLFLTALIGLGFYSYYQGRSHFNCLLGVLFPVPIIMGYLIERLQINLRIFARLKQLKPFYQALKIWNIFLCLALFSLSLFAFAGDIKEIKTRLLPNKNEGKIDDSILSENQIDPWNKHKDFILSLSKEDNLVVLTLGEEVFYQLLGVKDIYPFPSIIDMYFKTDYDKVLDYLETHNNTIMFTTYWLESFQNYDADRLNKILAKREKITKPPIILYRYVGE